MEYKTILLNNILIPRMV